MDETNQNLLAYRVDVRRIKNAILQSRYRTATKGNADMLSLYYGVGKYISANSRSGKWGMGAIEAISNQLQGEISGLRGFSPSNMKNMRMFYEQWSSELELNRQSATGDLEIDDSSGEIAQIRQLPIGELNETKISAFCRVGFTHK